VHLLSNTNEPPVDDVIDDRTSDVMSGTRDKEMRGAGDRAAEIR